MRYRLSGFMCAFLAAASAWAQAGAAQPLAAASKAQSAAATPAAAPKPMKIGNVVFTAILRSRMYAWDWFEPPTGTNEYAYSGNFLRLNFAEKFQKWDWDAEFAVPFFLGLPSTATNPAPQGALGLGSNYYTANHNENNTAMIFPKQLFIRLRPADGSALQMGRMEFIDGSEMTPKNATLATLKTTRIQQRLIGPFGFSDVQRSFDGLHYSYTKGQNDFTVLAAVPTRGVFQVDGWGWNRAAVGYAAWTHETDSKDHSSDSRVFFIDYDDYRHILKTDNRPAAVRAGDTENIRIETFGAHTVQSFATNGGTADLVGWGALQSGRWGTQRQRSYAFDIEAGLQPKILPKLKPWLRGGITVGSGDGNANDSVHGTFFQILPTPRPYARTPFFNMINNDDRWLSLITRPHPKVTISNEFHSLRLDNANDFWYSGGGVYQPWTFGFTGRNTSGRRSLANLYDLNVEFRASRRLTVTGYVGYVQGLAAMKQIYTADKDARLGMLEMLFRM